MDKFYDKKKDMGKFDTLPFSLLKNNINTYLVNDIYVHKWGSNLGHDIRSNNFSILPVKLGLLYYVCVFLTKIYVCFCVCEYVMVYV